MAKGKALTGSAVKGLNCSAIRWFLVYKWSMTSRSNLPFLISDIRALWRSVLSARAPECQKLKMVG